MLNQLNMFKKSFFVSKGVLYPFSAFYIMDFDKNANSTCRKQISSVVFKLV